MKKPVQYAFLAYIISLSCLLGMPAKAVTFDFTNLGAGFTDLTTGSFFVPNIANQYADWGFGINDSVTIFDVGYTLTPTDPSLLGGLQAGYAYQFSTSVAPFMEFQVDINPGSLVFDSLQFNPLQQGILVEPNVWQTVNASAGLWESTMENESHDDDDDLDDDDSYYQTGPKMTTLADYSSAHPNARVTRASIRVGGSPEWMGATGKIDNVVIGNVVFDFAPVPTEAGHCKKYGWKNFPQFKSQGDCLTYVQRTQ